MDKDIDVMKFMSLCIPCIIITSLSTLYSYESFT